MFQCRLQLQALWLEHETVSVTLHAGCLNVAMLLASVVRRRYREFPHEREPCHLDLPGRFGTNNGVAMPVHPGLALPVHQTVGVPPDWEGRGHPAPRLTVALHGSVPLVRG